MSIYCYSLQPRIATHLPTVSSAALPRVAGSDDSVSLDSPHCADAAFHMLATLMAHQNQLIAPSAE